MVIVTGGAGFIGSNIVKALNNIGITNVVVVDNLKNSNKFLNLVDLKITDFIDKEDFLASIVSRKKFKNIKAIFHKGACSSTMEQDGSYIMYNNYQFSKKLLHYCLEYKIQFLYASSAAVYGNCTSNFIESRKYEKPHNIYGYSKFLFDEYVRQLLAKIDSQVVGLRYFNVYGPHENHKGNMASIIFHINKQLNKGENPKLFEGSKNFKRDFIYIKDVVNINIWFLEKKISGIFNVGTGKAESFQKIANIILANHNKKEKFVVEYIPFPDTLKGKYQEFTQANLANLIATGYNKPFKKLSEGIIEYISWLNYKID